MHCGTVSENHMHLKCPTRDATCGKCNKRGHYAKICLLAPKKVGAITADDSEEHDEMADNDDGFFLGDIKNRWETNERTKRLKLMALALNTVVKVENVT